MIKNSFRTFFIAALLLASVMPLRSFADKYFEDNDAFFLKYLKQDKFPLDTSASAIVLYEYHSYDMNTAKLHVRKIIKIVKRSGSGYADIAIPLPGTRSGYYFVSVKSVHGTTYNLDGEKITKLKIDEDNVSLEQSGSLNEKKISMPAVREGSVIDYSYDMNGVKISQWDVQEEIPKLYSRFELCVPQGIHMDINDRTVPVFIQAEENKNTNDHLLPYSYTYDAVNQNGLTKQCWVRRNIPAFEEEPYLPCESNYREVMYMQISSVYFMGEHGILNSWDLTNAALVESYYFYRPYTESSAPIKQKARALAGNDTSELNIAKNIYKFVRDSVTSTGYTSMYTGKDLLKVLNDGTGNTAEINLLLIALMHHAGLTCSPMILATKDRETPSTEKADFNKYNYTICQLRINGQKYYLDASEKYNPFGRIPTSCLNGYARVIDKNKNDTCGIMLTQDMEKQKGFCSVTTTSSAIDDYKLNYKLYFSDIAAINHRTDWNKDTTEIKKYILSSFKDAGIDLSLVQYKVLNLNDPEKQLTLDFTEQVSWPKDKGAAIYLNPYFVKFFDVNPFKNPKRKYPVEFDGTQNFIYTLNLVLPTGFVVDEMPKSGVIKIDDKNLYKNLLDYNKESNTLSVDSRLQMNRVFYYPNEYDELREFFQKTSEEQQKTLVIKKLN